MAADVAHGLGNSQGESRFLVDEAKLRIDGLGWPFLEINDLEEARREIKTGLDIAEGLSLECNERNDLLALGYAFLARAGLQAGTATGVTEAQEWLAKATGLLPRCHKVIQYRILWTAGEVEHSEQNYDEAIRLYERAMEVEQDYGGEGASGFGELHYHLAIAYVDWAAGDRKRLEKAEEVFKGLTRVGEGKGESVVESVRRQYVSAYLARAKGNIAEARRLAEDGLARLSRLHINHKLQRDIEKFLKEIGN